MTQLQDEILRILNESSSNKEQLKEVSFDKITDEISKLNKSPDDIGKIIENPVQRLINQAQAASNSLKVALTAYNNVEKYYNAKMGNNEPTKTQAYNLDGTAIPNQTLKYNANNNTSTNNTNVDNSNKSKSTFLNPDYWYDKLSNKFSNKDKQKSDTNQDKFTNPYIQPEMTLNGQPFKNDGKYNLDIPKPKEPSLEPMHFQLNGDDVGNYGIYNPWKSKETPQPEQNNAVQSEPEYAPEPEPTVTPTVEPQSVPTPKATTAKRSQKKVEEPKKVAEPTSKVRGRQKKTSESMEESDLELQNEGLGDMISDMMINRKEKKEVINQLENASTMLTQADAQIGEAKQTYIIVYKQLQELAKQIETAKKLINKKKSWYGRTFGFWKQDKK